MLDRGSCGAINVLTFPPIEGVDRRFYLPWRGNKRFSKALGYAAGKAARFGYQLVDLTGRLEPGDCEALLTATEHELFGDCGDAGLLALLREVQVESGTA